MLRYNRILSTEISDHKLNFRSNKYNNYILYLISIYIISYSYVIIIEKSNYERKKEYEENLEKKDEVS